MTGVILLISYLHKNIFSQREIKFQFVIVSLAPSYTALDCESLIILFTGKI